MNHDERGGRPSWLRRCVIASPRSSASDSSASRLLTRSVPPDRLARMSSQGHLFSSESVTEGHPDKLADQISDAVLDSMLQQDANSRVACETLVTTGFVLVSGEITLAEGWVDIPSVV